MNKKLYHLRETHNNLGRYNAELSRDIFVLSPSDSRAIISVLKNDTVRIEILGIYDFVDVD